MAFHPDAPLDTTADALRVQREIYLRLGGSELDAVQMPCIARWARNLGVEDLWEQIAEEHDA